MYAIILFRGGTGFTRVPYRDYAITWESSIAIFRNWESLPKAEHVYRIPRTTRRYLTGIGMTYYPARRRPMERTAKILAARPSVLVCMEADPEFCHRSHLAAALAKRTGLPIKHLALQQ